LGDVRIGDSVLSLDEAGKAVFSTVYYIPHESIRDRETEFISVRHEGMERERDNVRADQTQGHAVAVVATSTCRGPGSGRSSFVERCGK
jgi:hypothetical protein